VSYRIWLVGSSRLVTHQEQGVYGFWDLADRADRAASDRGSMGHEPEFLI